MYKHTYISMSAQSMGCKVVERKVCLGTQSVWAQTVGRKVWGAKCGGVKFGA